MGGQCPSKMRQQTHMNEPLIRKVHAVDLPRIAGLITDETIHARFFVIDALPEMSATHNDTQRFDGHLILRLACRHALLTAENTKVLCFRV